MLAAGAARVMPAGSTRETIRRRPYAPAMASAHGSVLLDADGDEHTDLLYNHAALIHGHGYPPVTGAVTRQSRRLEAPFPDEHETALARLLTPRVPVDDPLFRFTSSGSEAVMLAVRLAAATTGRRKIVVLEHCYHGAFVPASQAESPSPNYLLCPFNAPDLLRHLFQNHGRQVAAVLADQRPRPGALSPATAAFAGQIREGLMAPGTPTPRRQVTASGASVRATSAGLARPGIAGPFPLLGLYLWPRRMVAPDHHRPFPSRGRLVVLVAVVLVV